MSLIQILLTDTSFRSNNVMLSVLPDAKVSLINLPRVMVTHDCRNRDHVGDSTNSYVADTLEIWRYPSSSWIVRVLSLGIRIVREEYQLINKCSSLNPFGHMPRPKNIMSPHWKNCQIASFSKWRSYFYVLDTVFSMDRLANVLMIPRSQISQCEHTIQSFHKLGKYR